MRSSAFFVMLFFLLVSTSIHGQENDCHCPAMTKKGRGTLYAGGGFHRIWFTRSDIHFKDLSSSNYDFVLHNVKARDDNHFNLGQGFDAPQYSYRLGYIFNNEKGLGIEFSFDHAKYIAVPNQRIKISGQINGIKQNGDTLLSDDFVEYEHTDGANYYMLSFVKRKPFLHSKNEKHWLSLVMKPGAGIVLPRSDTRIFGSRRNDKYHLAGYVAGFDGGLRYDFLRNFYLESTIKLAYANYRDVLLHKDGRANQHWFSMQAILMAGFQIPL